MFDDDKFSKTRFLIENLKKMTIDEYGHVIHKAFEYITEMGLDGDYLEFGSYSGYTMTWAYKAARKCGLNDMSFYAFDSFQGIPETTGIDNEFQEFKPGEFACTEKEFIKDIKRGGVDISRVTTIPGWFDMSLTEELGKKLPIKSAAVILIDCDIYASTVPVLKFICDYLVDGTVILFDDWHCFKSDPDKGEQRACREWLSRHPNIKLTQYKAFEGFGQSFIVKVAANKLKSIQSDANI